MPDERRSGVVLGPAPVTASATRAIWTAELRAIVALALPVVIQTTAQQGMTVTDQVFLGHLGTMELGASALANAYTNLMWFFLLGFATALDTLGSHAYGAGDRRALTTWCITAAVLLTVLVAPMALAMALGEAAGRSLLGQDDNTAALMGRFCDGLIPGMWPLMWGVVLTKYLQVQNIMLLPSLIAVATFFLNIAFNAVLVRTIGFGGAPLSTSLSRWAQFLLLVVAVWHYERRRRRQQDCKNEGTHFLAAAPAGEIPVPQLSATPYMDELCVAPRLRNDQSELMLLVTGADGEIGAAGLVAGTSYDSGAAGPGSVALSCSEAGRWRQEREADRERSGDRASLLGPADCSGPEADAAGAASAGTYCPPPVPLAPCMDLSRALQGSGQAAAEDIFPAAAVPEPYFWRVVYSECRKAMHPRVVGRFLRLGIPGGLSMAFEAGCFEFSTVLAGRLGAVATAAHAAMLSIVALTYLACPFALATAGSIRVGNLLGAGQPDGARRAGVLVVALSGSFMAVMAFTILATRNVLGYMFSTDQRVIQVIRDIAAFAALFQVSDGLMGSSQGVLRGCGHQHLTAVFNFVGFWVCGVLLGYLLCFKAGMGLKGLWAGISSGDTVTMVLNLVAMSRIRWGKEADTAVMRLKALEEQAEEKEAMLGGLRATGCSDDVDGDGDDDGRVMPGGDGGAPVVGGGRSYAGGLKRMWSERRVSQALAEARGRRELADMGRQQDSPTARMLRSLSSLFRKAPMQTGGGDGVSAAINRPRQLELLP